MTTTESADLGASIVAHRQRLLDLRGALQREQRGAVSPAVARALELADMQVFLALTYLGHTDELFPDELTVGRP
jgi:hypothetical protein